MAYNFTYFDKHTWNFIDNVSIYILLQSKVAEIVIAIP